MRGARPTYHHGALEAALVEEAVAQVRERGAEQVSLRGLAQAVGVSPSAAYQHFPDKAALLSAVGEWAFGELARQMRARIEAVTLEGDAGAVARFGATGRTYIDFALAEPHLFRHMFGGVMARPAECAEPAPKGTVEDGAFALLGAAIRELAERGLLRPGIGAAEGLDVLAWSLVHGFSSLVTEGHLPSEAALPVFGQLARMVLRDDVLAALDVDEIVRETTAVGGTA